ncbi:MAG: ABC transporter permease [Bacteroidaceae bacterium]|nr:ABC transporter permease [Bacteroidaceae bacterium]
MNLELFLARKLYSTRNGKRHLSRPAVTIAQWGVTIGTIVMFLSICIIVGFKNQVRDKVVGFGGHIQVMNYETSENGILPITVDSLLTQELLATEGVTHIQQYAQIPGIILANSEYEGIVLKGVGSDYNLSFFASNIIDGKLPQFTADEASNAIIISNVTANRLMLQCGDKVNVYFMQDGIRARKMTVAAIYETHLTEFDNVMALTDIYTTRKLNGWESNKASGVEITVDNFDNRYTCSERIDSTAIHDATKRNREGLYCATIDELYPAMFNWLAVLDQTVWIILVLVVCIAGFTMVSGLFILILEKSNFIGIMKAIGAKNLSIRKIFIYYAGMIVVKGMLIGNAIAIAACLVQQHTGIIAIDPEMYYMEKVPIEFSWLLVPMNIAMFVISIAILVIPSMLISKIEPVKAIKFE